MILNGGHCITLVLPIIIMPHIYYIYVCVRIYDTEWEHCITFGGQGRERALGHEGGNVISVSMENGGQ